MYCAKPAIFVVCAVSLSLWMAGRSVAGEIVPAAPLVPLAPPVAAPIDLPPPSPYHPQESEPPSPKMLQRPIESPPVAESAHPPEHLLIVTPVDAPSGFTGPSGVLPSESQENSDFVPVEDRWRLGMSPWDRYDKGHPCLDDYPYQEGHWWDPFNQNVLKGDYPIIGQHTFLNVTATSFSNVFYREVPTPATVFQSTANPGTADFFGRPGQFMYQQFFRLSLDLFEGDASFKPVDWRIKVTPVFNANTLNVNELAIVGPDVTEGTGRLRSFLSLQEWFAETKLADLSPDYDFVSLRVGSQPFVSDFRAFLFSDTNSAVRLFGNLNSNRDQFNVIVFDQMEKDTNSGLNDDFNFGRKQGVFIANYYHQDFIWPGYTAQFSVTYDDDRPSIKYNKNDALVRPDAAGVALPHSVDAVYLGWAGDGHIERFNITHQLYWVVGHDSMNPLGNQPEEINAWFAAAELSYDRDWARFKTSFLYASGDGNINNRHATGFDTILDDPNFAGGKFSYWQRNAIGLFGVNLKQAGSLVVDLRSSKIQGQANFVNPGLELLNFGVDVDLTPKFKWVNNLNFLWFDKTAVLEQFVFQNRIQRFIGTDISTGLEYRPLLSNNVIASVGLAALVPGRGFDDLYSNVRTTNQPTLLSTFVELELNY
jgi:hypothetical protein